jgi:hypothetical protein
MGMDDGYGCLALAAVAGSGWRVSESLRPSNHQHVIEKEMCFDRNRSDPQNTFETPTATPTEAVTRRANIAVTGVTRLSARPLRIGMDAPVSITMPTSDWMLPPER